MKTPLLPLLIALPILSVTAAELPAVRPMVTDRPDQTESPYSVPAGWFQMETSLLSYTRSLGGGPLTETFDWAASTMKLGLSTNTDVQVVFSPYLESIEDGQWQASGQGDTQVRLKWNLQGNDSGDFALAVMPYVKIPTAASGLGNDEWEGGLLVPATFTLSERASLSMMAFASLNASETGEHDVWPGASASLGLNLTESVGCYVESFAQYDSGSSTLSVALDGGVTWMLGENVQLDTGVNWFFAGERRLNAFVGLSFRF